MPRQPPTLRMRRLAAELRRLRQEVSGMTREEVTARTGVNMATLYRVETARARPQARTLRALLDVYGVEEPRRGELLALLRESTKPGWRHPLPEDVPEHAFVSFESEASEEWDFQPLVVPGLLQTEDYARAVIRGTLAHPDQVDLDSRVAARLTRRERLTGADPLRLHAIVDEAALRREVGGRAVMRAQLQRLRESARQPHVTLQVIPFERGAHPGMSGAFALLRYPEPGADVVYVEGPAGEQFLEDDAEVCRHAEVFERLREAALSPEASDELIAALAERA